MWDKKSCTPLSKADGHWAPFWRNARLIKRFVKSNSRLPNFMKICQAVKSLILRHRRTGRQTDRHSLNTKFSFLSSEIVPKNWSVNVCAFRSKKGVRVTSLPSEINYATWVSFKVTQWILYRAAWALWVEREIYRLRQRGCHHIYRLRQCGCHHIYRLRQRGCHCIYDWDNEISRNVYFENWNLTR